MCGPVHIKEQSLAACAAGPEQLPLLVSELALEPIDCPAGRVQRERDQTQQRSRDDGQPPRDLLPELLPRHDSISFTRLCTAAQLEPSAAYFEPFTYGAGHSLPVTSQ